MARKEKLSEADTLDTKSFEDPALYQDAEGKGAVLQTLDAPDNSKKNKDTIKGAAGQEAADADLQGVKEDVFAEMFDGEGLSESFKTKFRGIFEAELARRTDIITENLKSEFQEELEEKVSDVVENLSGKVDEYLNYVVENWMEENKLAVENGMRLQIAESFIDNLKDLFENHYITIPDSKVNILDEMFEKSEDYKKQLDEALEVNSELYGAVEQYRKSDIAHNLSEGLTELDKQKFISLSEDVSFESDEDYTEKLQAIRESYFGRKTSKTLITEDETTHEPQKLIEEASGVMGHYLKAIEKQSRKG